MITKNAKNIFKQSCVFSSVLESVTHLLWPPFCDVCGELVTASDNGLCSDCWDEVMALTADDYCPTCGKNASRYAIIDSKCGNCSQFKFNFNGLARAGLYEGAIRKRMLNFKFNDKTELAGFLGSMADAAFQASVFYEEIDMLVPVPLHWIRRLRRGFNQAHLLARHLVHPSAEINTDLVRIRNTHRQWAQLNAAKRKKNVDGAFTVRKRHNYSGKRLCLVDDITTTWATLNECAKTLKLAGAKEVYAVVVAVAI